MFDTLAVARRLDRVRTSAVAAVDVSDKGAVVIDG